MKLIVVVIAIVGCSSFVTIFGEKTELNHESDDGEGDPGGGPNDGGLVEELGAVTRASGEQGSGCCEADGGAKERGDEGGGPLWHHHPDQESEGKPGESGADCDEFIACGALVEVCFDGLVHVFDELF